jgi:hypothetical protein
VLRQRDIVLGVATFEVGGDRNVDGRRDAFDELSGERDRDVFAVAVTLRLGD